MNEPVSTPNPAPGDSTATDQIAASDGAAPLGGSRLRPGRLVAMALGAGLVAGLASFLLGEVFLDYFRPPSRAVLVGTRGGLPAAIRLGRAEVGQ